ncbi:Cu/Zn superoxide dismutase [Acetobacter indonesiensis NRIC 0313]|jgi:Cu-Zn family superoxide dismutase|uniref:Superoxide dismutase n=1 Tax=Acetobacter indonesiensis TaxID=104101 RepID=A0A252AQP8_9PROT|nr:superoxide dismutase family protein [Acetobacter indonesiensis]MCI1436894.1 superoxide dismutase family protein [Acetobacter indonesiensis]MCI1545983.1 superoxide dismutase family protein [Acetobacter indonesiensis]MCI1765429.1 superoxide dismutase family protein [Acetobacter indonesiensis]MCP1229748.1 superoxide dismutase family protein [Acetobacter indonesiensis]OUI92145.1 superoxide dismutase [Acetobacter indonesiensis]
MFASRLKLVAALVCGVALAPAFAQAADTAGGDLLGTDGASHGSVHVTAAPAGVILRIEAKGLTPGWHGVHFHEKGSCEPPKFTSAGGHVHTAKPVTHGLLNDKANDDGDLPNIYVAADGTATVELYSTLVSLNNGGKLPGLLDADGSSLVIHAKPDDYKTQPIGGAGDRVACAVLK